MIKEILQATLQQLDELLTQLNSEEYVQKDTILSGSSIGMHVRHIIEFVGCVLDGEKTGTICYDDRKRDEILQTDVQAVKQQINEISIRIDQVNQEQSIQLVGFYGVPKTFQYNLTSSIERELAYNIEHAIHHMAMIKIAVNQLFPHITLDTQFGVAHSTLRHEQA